MKTVTNFPYPIREIENAWIELKDGTRLAARIWMPVDAEEKPVPAVLEYLPYRKGDAMSVRDSRLHPYVAGHGYALVRVDIRGTGESDGILYDEYLKQEQDDALEVVDWITAQKWCDGNLGIIGISWSGFNGLQIAARRPPPLKAIITLCSTDDRYADDVHYMGGLVDYDALPWASTMFAFNALPPDPRLVGERWREMWMHRMRETPPYIEAWLSHQTRDAFWKHGSVCENFDDITCAVFAVGGWNDGYSNAIPRLLDGLKCPRKGLIGPWPHAHPSDATPGPSIGWLQEVVRWWDYWLKGIDNGIMNEPMLRVWMQESVPPRTHYKIRPGRWVAESQWQSPRIQSKRFWFGAGSLDAAKVENIKPMQIETHLGVGLASGVWCPYGYDGELPADQRGDDAFSLTFDSPIVAEATEILGFPEVTLKVSADKPNAMIAVRLCDVSQNGESYLVTLGVFNLTHHESHEFPKLLTLNEPITVKVKMNAIAHQLPPGHRWRVSLSPSYWPMVWTSPEKTTLTLFSDASFLELPMRQPAAVDNTLRAYGEPEEAKPIETNEARNETAKREWRIDRMTGDIELNCEFDHGSVTYAHNGITLDDTARDVYRINENDPLSASVRCERKTKMSGKSWRIRVETESEMSCDANYFYLVNTMRGYEEEKLVFEKTWQKKVVRMFA
jgi:hypothetical protein